jgi:hypothetical protein
MRRKIRKIIQTKKNEHVQGIIIIINAYYSDLLLYDYDYDYIIIIIIKMTKFLAPMMKSIENLQEAPSSSASSSSTKSKTKSKGILQ